MGRRQSKKQSRRFSKMSGGNNANSSVYPISVYGGQTSQQSVEQAGMGRGNEIVMKGGNLQAYESPNQNLSYSHIGGKRRRKNKGGSGILTDLAVPAVLVLANQTMNKRSKTHKRRSFRKRR